MTTSEHRCENSLQTAVRWTWTGILYYCTFKGIVGLLFPKAPPPMPTIYSVRTVMRTNANLMRKAGIHFAAYRTAYQERNALSRQSVAALRALGYNPDSIDPIPSDVSDNLPTTPLIRDANRRLEYAKEQMLDLLSRVNFATKAQQQRIERMRSIVAKHDAVQAAKEEADEADGDLQEEKNFRDIYNYAVKHGHIDPTKTTLDDCKQSWSLLGNPRQLSWRFKAIAAIIIAGGWYWIIQMVFH